MVKVGLDLCCGLRGRPITGVEGNPVVVLRGLVIEENTAGIVVFLHGQSGLLEVGPVGILSRPGTADQGWEAQVHKDKSGYGVLVIGIGSGSNLTTVRKLVTIAVSNVWVGAVG